MDLISKKYQEYSGRDRRRGLNQGIEYLQDQLKETKKRAME